MPEPVNPVTFRGVRHRTSKEGVNVSIGRMGIGPSGQVKNYVTVLVWDGPDNEPRTLAECIMDEDHFVRGLQHLFPRGELQAAQ